MSIQRWIPGRHLRLAITALLLLAGPVATVHATPTWVPTTDLGSLRGDVSADGSSTVAPITEAAAEDFYFAGARHLGMQVNISGTGGGFKRFCAGETDLQDASRPIKDEERETCAAKSVDYYEFAVAYDGLVIAVNPANDWVSCLTVDQLKKMWEPGSAVASWADIDPSFPDQPLNLYGPGTDSGTFDYFTKVIVGDEGHSRTDFTPSEDDNVLVAGVSGDIGALAYFGLAYYEENRDSLKLVAVDGGDGCVDPSVETVRDLSYSPLSRPLYVYVNAASLERPEVREFMRFYVANAGYLAGDVGYVSSPDATYAEDQRKLDAAIAGEAAPDGPQAPVGE